MAWHRRDGERGEPGLFVPGASIPAGVDVRQMLIPIEGWDRIAIYFRPV